MLKHVMINGKYTYYEDEGKGTPILFLHPPGVGRKIFRYQSAYLKHKFRIIAIDLSGSGDSGSCLSRISLKERAEEVFFFIKKLGLENVHLAAYSGGCAIALTAALRFPKEVKALILIEGFARVEQRLHHYLYKASIKMLEEREELAIRLISSHLTNDVHLREILKNHMRKSDIQVWISDYRNLLEFNISPHLKEISVPSLVILGVKSKFAAKSAALCNEMPGSKEVIIKGSGLILKKWEKVNGEIAAFMKTTEQHGI
ncbi:pimeloyl-ACP methyl ester carboxylesterase [Peribacillus deserti]|uniref:Pimeloyl-ACP methyl ester carboxylesterase n=1 Tax=Peribacillus deserti TaxID=673318 RepID=A0ABS2QJR7_9BACI|nr:alpha/beta hydrolase [Peribacillus deserti]MBM7693399.1 pimeloyl-ACP methyl ester carboxylesterase [Peribacillus deserti]